jgi:dsRNA-specific ribonuclease
MPSSHRRNSRSQQDCSWQEKLAEICQDYQIQAPNFQIVSDRRGGRTAWSSVVTVYGQQISARFWYDGKNLHNAKEDAAEAAILWLQNSNTAG